MSQRVLAAFVAFATLMPTLAIPAMPANAQTAPPPAKGMSTKTKLVLLTGAALLYYLYRRHQASVAAQVQPPPGQPKQAQLYRSKNGGIYYRDIEGKAVWLTSPSKSLQVPATDVQKYAPDYANYSGPAPAAPSGNRTQSFDQFDPGVMHNSAPAAAPAKTGAPSGPPGPHH